MSSDASLNLYDAICVAVDPASRGKGVLVVSNDEIHTARDVVKTNSFKLDAFKSPYGPLGHVVEGQPRYYRTTSRDHTVLTPWSIDRIERLPKVDIVYAYGALDAQAIGNVLCGTDGLVYAGTGNGNVAEHIVAALRQAARDGVQIVRASRTGSGVVVRDGAQPDSDYGWIVVDDQVPQKARILLMLAMLSTPNERDALQAAFYRY